jgi:beta-lactam-binding protein with PASTA domain
MLRFLKLLTQSLLLLLIALFSALAAMRLAIHGREVRVPDLRGMAMVRAEAAANDSGLIVSIEDRFYSSTVGEGEVISQFPAAGSRVRRGWRIRVAESLGPQRVTIPDLKGQTELAATLNLHQRSLELGTISPVPSTTTPPGEIVAQSPPPDATEVAEPKVNVLIAEPPAKPEYVMPDFIGRDLSLARQKIAKAGLPPPQVYLAPALPTAAVQAPPPNMAVGPVRIPNSGKIISQSPAPGSRVRADTQTRLQIAR